MSDLYCADAFAGQSAAWIRAYPWVAYCNAAMLGGMSEGNCGKCLRLTNLDTGTAQASVGWVWHGAVCGHKRGNYQWVGARLAGAGGQAQQWRGGGSCARGTEHTPILQIVRIVDECGNGAIDSDWATAFKPLDTDGQGYFNGQMTVKVELVTGC